MHVAWISGHLLGGGDLRCWQRFSVGLCGEGLSPPVHTSSYCGIKQPVIILHASFTAISACPVGLYLERPHEEQANSVVEKQSECHLSELRRDRAETTYVYRSSSPTPFLSDRHFRARSSDLRCVACTKSRWSSVFEHGAEVEEPFAVVVYPPRTSAVRGRILRRLSVRSEGCIQVAENDDDVMSRKGDILAVISPENGMPSPELGPIPTNRHVDIPHPSGNCMVRRRAYLYKEQGIKTLGPYMCRWQKYLAEPHGNLWSQ